MTNTFSPENEIKSFKNRIEELNGWVVVYDAWLAQSRLEFFQKTNAKGIIFKDSKNVEHIKDLEGKSGILKNNPDISEFLENLSNWAEENADEFIEENYPNFTASINELGMDITKYDKAFSAQKIIGIILGIDNIENIWSRYTLNREI